MRGILIGVTLALFGFSWNQIFLYSLLAGGLRTLICIARGEAKNQDSAEKLQIALEADSPPVSATMFPFLEGAFLFVLADISGSITKYCFGL